MIQQKPDLDREARLTRMSYSNSSINQLEIARRNLTYLISVFQTKLEVINELHALKNKPVGKELAYKD